MTLAGFIVAILANILVGYFATSRLVRPFDLGDFEEHRSITVAICLGIIIGMFSFGAIAKDGAALNLVLAVLANVAVALVLAGLTWLNCWVDTKLKSD